MASLSAPQSASETPPTGTPYCGATRPCLKTCGRIDGNFLQRPARQNPSIAGLTNVLYSALATINALIIPVDHLYGRHVLCDYINSMNIPDLVVCSPDVGFAKSASQYAKILGVPVVIGNKHRADHTENAEILEVIGDVAGKNVVLVDDFTITGRTLINMANALKQRGAKDIYAAVTHAVLSKGAAPLIGESQIKQMLITDTVEAAFDPLPPNIRVVSVAPFFAEAIRSIHDRTSVSMLFPEP